MIFHACLWESAFLHVSRILLSILAVVKSAILGVIFSRTNSAWCLYHLSAWQNFDILLNDTPFSLHYKYTCIFLCQFAVFNYTINILITVTTLTPLSVCYQVLVWSVLMALICNAIKMDLVSSWKFQLPCHDQVIKCIISLVCLLI